MMFTYILTRSAPHSWKISDFPAMGSGLARKIPYIMLLPRGFAPGLLMAPLQGAYLVSPKNQR